MRIFVAPLALCVMTAFNTKAMAIGKVAHPLSGIARKGQVVAVDPVRGNCLACHQMGDGESPGDLGPPLVAMKARFPNKNMLRGQIWDPMENNPNSRMPPYGRHRILTEEEIDMVVEYIYSL